ncbi:unnamed protein product [Gongylonema pulchrum]|uniref:PDEase domain-containing protein n=1 Tax=Gongylonema pulchrum TaxID=637853 RepID=A0A183D8J7_9BILA|nr:unnamed protein product [Gongylonema pulchrum]
MCKLLNNIAKNEFAKERTAFTNAAKKFLVEVLAKKDLYSANEYYMCKILLPDVFSWFPVPIEDKPVGWRPDKVMMISWLEIIFPIAYAGQLPNAFFEFVKIVGGKHYIFLIRVCWYSTEDFGHYVTPT